MVVADARALPPSSLARTVREQGLQLTKLKAEHDFALDELRQEDLDLRVSVNDIAESLAALIAALLPACPSAAEGGAVPTAASITTAAATAHATSAAASSAAPPAAGAETSAVQQALEVSAVERAATTIQAAARGRTSRAQTAAARRLPARVELVAGGSPAALAVATEPVGEPNLGDVVSEMRELASYVQQLPTGVESAADSGAARPASAPARAPHTRFSAAGKNARRPPMATVPENHARPQSAPARRHKRDEQSTMDAADKAEARRAVEVARQSVAVADMWKHGLPAEDVPARRTAVHGGPRPASAGSSRPSSGSSSRTKQSGATEGWEFETGGVRQESEEAWLARQPGGKSGHLSYVKARTQNPRALTKESDKQALVEKARDANLARPPVQWVEQGQDGWGHWVATAQKGSRAEEEASDEPGWQDAVQVSHTTQQRASSSSAASSAAASRARSRPQSAPPSSSPASQHQQQIQTRRQKQQQQQQHRGGSAGSRSRNTRRPSAAARSIPPIFVQEDDDEYEEDYQRDESESVAAAAGGGGGGGATASTVDMEWTERAEWKREQKKWSQLARGALRSMEEDEELTDLALMMRQMENDPGAAAAILGEAAVAAADAAIATQQEQEEMQDRTMSERGARQQAQRHGAARRRGRTAARGAGGAAGRATGMGAVPG